MKLTTKGRYAVTAMLDLALHRDKGPISLAEISMRQGISLSYLEQLFARLRRNSLVKSTRGPGGGYSLARAPKDIAIAEIITAVDERVDSTGCGGNEDCQEHQRCLTHGLWQELSAQIRLFLSEISLADTMNRTSVLEVAARQDKIMNEQSIQFEPNLKKVITSQPHRSFS